MEKEGILKYCTKKKASFDGTSYRFQLSKKVVQFLEEKKIPVDDYVQRGMFPLGPRVYFVQIIFGDFKEEQKLYKKTVPKETEPEEKEKTDNESDYAVLGEQ